MNKKYKLNKIVLINETLEPKIIEIGKIEKSFGIFVFTLFIFLFKPTCYSMRFERYLSLL